MNNLSVCQNYCGWLGWIQFARIVCLLQGFAVNSCSCCIDPSFKIVWKVPQQHSRLAIYAITREQSRNLRLLHVSLRYTHVVVLCLYSTRWCLVFSVL